MKPKLDRRLSRLTQRIEARPIAPEVEESAFQKFCQTGELPEPDRLAAAVLQRALQPAPSDKPETVAEFFQHLRELADSLRSLEDNPQAYRSSVRTLLFREAMDGNDLVRLAARQLLAFLVKIGWNVTEADSFIEPADLPEHGSVALHFLQFPQCIVRPPHEAAAQRLLDQIEDLRERVRERGPDWEEGTQTACVQFLQSGELPDDELAQSVVLAMGELHWHFACYCGVGDPEVMAAFDEAALVGTVASLQELGQQGRLQLPTPPDRRPS